jgi:hypothetical protein
MLTDIKNNDIFSIYVVPREMSPLISDYDDSSSNDDFETETQVEFQGKIYFNVL